MSKLKMIESQRDHEKSGIAKQPIELSNLVAGAILNVMEVTTAGQPLEVIKTHMAANRKDNLRQSVSKIWNRGGVLGFYQGLIPWAWVEASTKGAILLFSASEIEYLMRANLGLGKTSSSIIGGMGGGICQAYATMGFCTFMKTVEITRDKSPLAVRKSTLQVAREVLAKEGIKGINKGVNAVAFRQCTNWGSRFGLSRVAESAIRKAGGIDVNQDLSVAQRACASALGGGLSCWNQPIEVIRVEMQSQIKSATRAENLTMFLAAKEIYTTAGLKGFFRGITPR